MKGTAIGRIGVAPNVPSDLGETGNSHGYGKGNSRDSPVNRRHGNRLFTGQQGQNIGGEGKVGLGTHYGQRKPSDEDKSLVNRKKGIWEEGRRNKSKIGKVYCRVDRQGGPIFEPGNMGSSRGEVTNEGDSARQVSGKQGAHGALRVRKYDGLHGAKHKGHG